MSWEGLGRKEMSGEGWIDRKGMSCVGSDGKEVSWEGLGRRGMS